MTNKIGSSNSTSFFYHLSGNKKSGQPYSITHDMLQQIRAQPVKNRPSWLARQLCIEVLRRRFGLTDQTSPQYQRLLSQLASEIVQLPDFLQLLQHHQLITSDDEIT
jgi:hypothetical protein